MAVFTCKAVVISYGRWVGNARLWNVYVVGERTCNCYFIATILELEMLAFRNINTGYISIIKTILNYNLIKI